MLLNDKAMTRLVNDLAFELQDMRIHRDSVNPYADGVWAGIYRLLHAQAMTANTVEGVDVDPHKVKDHIEQQVRVAFAELFPEDYYPEED